MLGIYSHQPFATDIMYLAFTGPVYALIPITPTPPPEANPRLESCLLVTSQRTAKGDKGGSEEKRLLVSLLWPTCPLFGYRMMLSILPTLCLKDYRPVSEASTQVYFCIWDY